jgi:predicted secreted protein
MKSIFLPLFLTVQIQTIYASGDNPTIGARAIAIGQAAASIKDVYSIFNNVAGITEINSITGFTAYHIPYSILSIRDVAAGLLYPYKQFKLGISAYDFGNDSYNQTNIGIAVAHKIKNISLGLKINYQETSISELNAKRRLVLEFGGITEFTKHLHLGAHLYNVNQASIGENPNAIPVVMKVGVSLLPTETLRIFIETEKSGTYQPYVKAGVEYVIHKTLALRTGIRTNDYSSFYGIGWKQPSFTFDFAISYHSYLGVSQSLSLTYQFNKKK